MKEVTVGIVGATGAVGQEFLQLFQKRQWNIVRLELFASAKSAGKLQEWNSSTISIRQTDVSILQELDMAFFSAGSSVSNEIIKDVIAKDCIVIDNSSAYRMTCGVPLIVPEINSSSLTAHDRIIANPNCSAIVMLMAVAPLRKLGQIKRIIVSTYQSASGGGTRAMEELLSQTSGFLDGNTTLKPNVLKHAYAFNLFSHDTPVADNGYNQEENKIIEESRKILDDPDILINPTCIRVPVLRAHSESITVEFEKSAPSVDEVLKVLGDAPGVRIVNDIEANHFPMPREASGQDDVLVGRVRQDISNPKAISLFACGDQLLKGAALNAVQIGEEVIRRGFLKSS